MMCTVDLSRVPDEVIDAGVAVFNQRNGRDFPPSDVMAAGRSVVQRVTQAPKLQRAMASIEAPVLVLHGARDRHVPVRAARQAAKTYPHSRLEVAENVGHVPMLEAAEWTAGHILDWLVGEVLNPADPRP